MLNKIAQIILCPNSGGSYMKNILMAVLLLTSPCIFATDYSYDDITPYISLDISAVAPAAETCASGGSARTLFIAYLKTKYDAIHKEWENMPGGITYDAQGEEVFTVSTYEDWLKISEMSMIKGYYLDPTTAPTMYGEEDTKKDCNNFVTYCSGAKTVKELNEFGREEYPYIKALVDSAYTPNNIWAPTCAQVGHRAACITIPPADKTLACGDLLAKN